MDWLRGVLRLDVLLERRAQNVAAILFTHHTHTHSLTDSQTHHTNTHTLSRTQTHHTNTTKFNLFSLFQIKMRDLECFLGLGLTTKEKPFWANILLHPNSHLINKLFKIRVDHSLLLNMNMGNRHIQERKEEREGGELPSAVSPKFSRLRGRSDEDEPLLFDASDSTRRKRDINKTFITI